MEYISLAVIISGILSLWFFSFRRTYAAGDENDKTRLWFTFIFCIVVCIFVFVVFVWPEFYCSPYLCNFGELVLSIMFAGLVILISPVVLLVKISKKTALQRKNKEVIDYEL